MAGPRHVRRRHLQRGRRTTGAGLLGLALTLVCALTGCTGSAGSTDPAGATPAGLTCASRAATAPVAPMSPAVGVQFHGTWSDYTDAQRRRVLDLMAQTGMGWVRIDAHWTDLQPRSPGRWNAKQLAVLDTSIDLARQRGLQVLITFLGTPGWAGGGRDGLALPAPPSRYATALAYLADRYRGEVAAWEVWNEPNSEDFARGADPVGYTRLLQAAYPAVKAVDATALVVFGGTMYNDADFVAAAYAAGAKDSFDVMATHPYPAPSDAAPTSEDDGTIYTMGHVRAVRQVMTDYGDTAKPVWFTEVGWSTHPNEGDEEGYERGVTDQEQADHLVDTLRLVAADLPYVDHVFWYAERDRQSGAAQIANFGLLTKTLEPKAAAQALTCHLRSGG
jgi:hypothetical protein